jgi:hypothetical protein
MHKRNEIEFCKQAEVAIATLRKNHHIEAGDIISYASHQTDAEDVLSVMERFSRCYRAYLVWCYKLKLYADDSGHALLPFSEKILQGFCARFERKHVCCVRVDVQLRFSNGGLRDTEDADDDTPPSVVAARKLRSNIIARVRATGCCGRARKLPLPAEFTECNSSLGGIYFDPKI